jgi:drug/metabolite transporter (DMT)-like permease
MSASADVCFDRDRREVVMTGVSLALVLVAACVHATWNVLAKRARGGAAFIWLFSAISAILYAPFAIAVLLIQQPHIGGVEVLFMVGTGVLHVAYFLALQRGYRVGDLSLVYPLARGTGPTLSTIGAILFFGERPTALAMVGALLVVVGVFILTGGTYGAEGRRRWAIGYGLLTGTIIAAYTLWDKHAVSTLNIPPLLLDYSSSLGRVVLLAPVAFHQRANVACEWRSHHWEVVGVALLSPLSYILVLTALATTPVSYIAPARELSILIGAAIGARVLVEGDVRRRLTAAGAIVAGVVALALG